MNRSPFQKRVLITGANRGIGRAIVECAAERAAARIYAGVRNLDSANELVERYGSLVQPIQIDLDAPETIKAAARQATDAEIVINNAGIMHIASPFDDDAIPLLNRELQINVVGLLQMARAFAPVLRANGGGAFVQLNSVASVRASASFSTYCVSKAASYSITQSLKDQLAQQGTHVLSVHPGPTQSDMGSAAGFDEIATPAADVATALFDAIDAQTFHAWVGPLAELVSHSYAEFSQTVIEGDMRALREQAFS